MRVLLSLVFAVALQGACATDAKGVCNDPANASIARLIGKVAPLSSPWPFYNIAAPLILTDLTTAALAHPPTLGAAIAGSGTCTYTDGPSALQCTGSNFTSLTCRTCGGTITQLIVAWNTIYGAGTGRYLDTIETITDDTHLLFTTSSTRVTPGTNLAVYLAPAQTSTYSPAFWEQYPGNYGNAWNYYGTCPSIYRHYIKTADSAWLTTFRTWADIWWTWSSDHGRISNNTRDVDWLCVFIRALDGHPERMAPIYDAAMFESTQPNNDATNYTYPIRDTRERGYMLANYVEGAIADTAANGGSDAHHTWYCDKVSTQITGWLAHQESNGLVDLPVFLWADFPYSGKSNSPWQSNVWVRAWEMAYEVLNDTDPLVGCNQPAQAALLLTAIGLALDWQYDEGISKVALGGNGYAHYSVGSPSNGLTYVTGTGTIATTLSSTDIVGTGTNFTGQLGCNSTKFVALQTRQTAAESVYKVVSCSDNTHGVITPAFGTYGETANDTASPFLVPDAASTNCASTASYCDIAASGYPAPNGDPNAIRDFAGNQGWMWVRTGDVKYKTRGDELFARAFRGPADGPYGTLAPAGPGGLAYGGSVTDENGVACGLGFTCKDSLTQSLVTSCGNGCGDGPFVGQGKNWAQAFGFMCADCYIAYRLMDALTPAPTPTFHITGHPVIGGHPVIQ